MKKLAAAMIAIVATLMMLSITGCSGAANTPASAAPVSGASASPAVSAQAPISAPAAAASAAFKYYGEVDIGMTKDMVEKTTGLTPKADTSDAVPEGQTAFYYLDGNGEGIYVLYDKDSKLTSKTVQYNDAAAALVPFTAKPVTQGECDKIANGMPHADVVKLLGSEGAECNKTQSVVFGKTTVGTIYRWGNPDGTFIQVVFLNDGTAQNAMFFN
jgi:hypothetical protein